MELKGQLKHLRYEAIGVSVKYTTSFLGNGESFAPFFNLNLLHWFKTLQGINCERWKRSLWQNPEWLSWNKEKSNFRFTKSAFYSLPAEWLHTVDQYDITDWSLGSSLSFRIEPFIPLILQHNNPKCQFSGTPGGSFVFRVCETVWVLWAELLPRKSAVTVAEFECLSLWKLELEMWVWVRGEENQNHVTSKMKVIHPPTPTTYYKTYDGEAH